MMWGIKGKAELSLLPSKHFEKKFETVVRELGTYELEKLESKFLLIPYYIMRLQCKSGRFQYATQIIGDEFDEDEDARESVFRKAYFVVMQKFRPESAEIEKKLRRNQN